VKKIHEQGLDSHRAVVEYSAQEELKQQKSTINGLGFIYRDEEFSLPLLGNYNFENCLAAIKATEDLLTISLIKKSLRDFTPLVGRMEVLQKEPYIIIVDFAHTPNGLRSALETVKSIKRKKARTIVVFGCAGLRDQKKRTMMGEIAARHADIIILTAEDPRTERLKDINGQIISGARRESNDLHHQAFKQASDIQEFEPSTIYHNNLMNTSARREALKLALSFAKEGDVVIITGKGHEKSLCFGEKEYPWSDQEEVKRLLS
jgi:UDP-N-acetylmuramoyl-L-alanyl-D-glutamate--2,6-diaminopimelate ligase